MGVVCHYSKAMNPLLRLLSALCTEFAAAAAIAAAVSLSDVLLLTRYAIVAIVFALWAFACEWVLDSRI